MHYYKEYQLDQLGISSPKEADELQRDLDIRFDQFSYNDREDWVQQNAYLDAFAHTRTVSDAANEAGVTISTAQHWKYLNTLGFKHRLEEAELRFSDRIQVIALERVKEPNAPVALLITFLRAYIPEKFSANAHVCDTSKDEDRLYRYRQGSQRELDAGHSTFRAIADGTYQHPNAPSADNPHSSRPRRRVASPVMEEGWGEGNDPSHDDGPPSFPDDDIQPIDPDEVAYFNLPPNERKNTPHPSASSAPSAVNPPDPSHDDGPPSFPDDDIQPIDPDEVAYFNLPPNERKNTPHPSASSAPSAVNPPDPSYGDGPPSFPDDDIQPIDPDEVAYFNLPPNERKNTPHPSASSAPSAVNPPESSHDEPNTFPVKRF